jgi:hypothetical protein
VKTKQKLSAPASVGLRLNSNSPKDWKSVVDQSN